MRYAWGIDVGVASLGFAIIELDKSGNPAGLIDGVSVIYPAPTGAAERTRYKSIRTQTKRRAKRMKILRVELARLFNLDRDFDTCVPDFTDGIKENGEARTNNSRVRLRAQGLSYPLSAGDLARAILHIAKNRGQRLTRGLKEGATGDPKKIKEQDKVRESTAARANDTKAALVRLGEKLGLSDYAHPAQLLINNAGETGTTRLKKDRDGTPIFTRTLMQRELTSLLLSQQPHHSSVITDEFLVALVAKVFHEHEPKPPAIGKCRYGMRSACGAIESRIPRGSDLFQRKRIFEEVNNLRLISTRTAAETVLTLEQRNDLAAVLLDGKDLSAAKVREVLKLDKGALADKTTLDISDKGRKTTGKLAGHPLAAAMASGNALEQWRSLDDGQREGITHLVCTEDDTETLDAELMGLGLGPEEAKALSDARLPATYSAAGQTATRLLLAELEKDVISNYEAEQRAGLLTDQTPTRLDRLPYYGAVLTRSCIGGSEDPKDRDEVRHGRIPNPVVHVALNQIRKLANAYLDIYGKPVRICIELARDMNKSAEARERAEKDARANRKRNEKYIETIGAHTRKLNPDDMTRMKLHEFQGGECMYTGRTICMEHLFDGSVQIDHILPRADTHDDGIANLALVFEEANQFKRKRTPFDAFNQGYAGQDYAHILARAWKRGKGVYWRFRENAMERFKDQDAFRSRFLNDTRYVGKMAAQYLGTVCADPNGVVCLNGRITADLRHTWGLSTVIRNLMIADGRLNADEVNRPREGETLKELSARRKRLDKIRWDHRHHLLDAIVAACTTRSDVQRLHTLMVRDTSGQSAVEILAEARRAEPDFRNVGVCWRDGFRSLVENFLRENGRGTHTDKVPVTAVVVKADHDPSGQLHKETNYGVICPVPGQPSQYVAHSHIMLDSLKKQQIEEIGVPSIVLTSVADAMEKGVPIWWGGNDPLSALRDNLSRDLGNLKARLLVLMDETPAEELAKVHSEDGREMARKNFAVGQYIRETGRRRYTKVEIISLRVLQGPVKNKMKPRRANATRGNDRLIYFINREGGRDWEVISTFDATTSGFRERWKHEGGRHLFTLRKDDLVEMVSDPGDPTSPRRLYRTVSFSPTKTAVDVEFLPVEESRAPKEVPNNVRIRIRNLRSFWERMPVMVLCDPTGRVRWRGPSMN